MNKKDLSQPLLEKFTTILENCKAIEEKVNEYVADFKNRPNIDKELLLIFANAVTAHDMICPLQSTQEIFGTTGSSKSNLQVEHALRDPSWNFDCWLKEKVTYVRNHATNLVTQWHVDISTVEMNSDANMTANDYQKYLIMQSFTMTKRYTLVLLEEICRDNLSITKN